MNRALKRRAQKALSTGKAKVATAVVATSVAVGNASAAVTMPTADYSTIEGAATIGFGITIVVGLLYKAKGFFR